MELLFEAAKVLTGRPAFQRQPAESLAFPVFPEAARFECSVTPTPRDRRVGPGPSGNPNSEQDAVTPPPRKLVAASSLARGASVMHASDHSE